jgi:hypothetical protein
VAAAPDGWWRQPLWGAVDRYKTRPAESTPEEGRWISILTADSQAEVHLARRTADPRSGRHTVATSQARRRQFAVGGLPPVGMSDHDVYDASDCSAVDDGAGSDGAYRRRRSNPVLDPPIACTIRTARCTKRIDNRAAHRGPPARRGHRRSGLDQHEADQGNRCDTDNATSHDDSSRQSDSDGRRSVERGRMARGVRLR